MTAIDRASPIEAAAKAISTYQHVSKGLKSLREAHAGEWNCGNPSHTNPDVGCPDCLLYCASCDVEIPCPTIRMLDQIESDVKGDE